MTSYFNYLAKHGLRGLKSLVLNALGQHRVHYGKTMLKAHSIWQPPLCPTTMAVPILIIFDKTEHLFTNAIYFDRLKYEVCPFLLFK